VIALRAARLLAASCGSGRRCPLRKSRTVLTVLSRRKRDRVAAGAVPARRPRARVSPSVDAQEETIVRVLWAVLATAV
jgi:hypothetical protein